MSQEIGLSPAPTLERVRKLEMSGYIKSYHALVDEEKLGLGIKTFIQVQLDFHKNNTIQIFLDEVNQIINAVLRQKFNVIYKFIRLAWHAAAIGFVVPVISSH